MEVKVCKNCRRLFRYMYGPDLCPECAKIMKEEKADPIIKKLNATLKPLVQEDETKFNQVRDFIMTHPKATVTQIAEINDISPTKLFEWIREDRLEFSEDSEYAWFTCEKCGIKIKSGRLCNRCKPLRK
jgi:phage antirepressor YoqD-like protein